jgi:hypothetical protein
VTLAFRGHDADGSAGPTRALRIEPGRTWVAGDVLGTLFSSTDDHGALAISSTSALVIAAVTSSSGAGWNVHQTVPVVRDGDLIRSGERRSIPAIFDDPGVRSSLVIANGRGAGLRVDLRVISQLGAVLGVGQVSLPSYGMTRIRSPWRALGVATDLIAARLELSTATAGGAFTAFVSSTDQGSQDGMAIEAR